MDKTKTKDAVRREQEAGARYADAYVLEDGTVHEYGGQCRTWPSVEAFHQARGWRAAALFFPAGVCRAGAVTPAVEAACIPSGSVLPIC